MGDVVRHPGQCIACLADTQIDFRGWCSPCRRRHRCFHCERVSATVSAQGASCGYCRRILAQIRATRLALDRVARREAEVGVVIPVCHDPRIWYRRRQPVPDPEGLRHD